MLDLNEKQKTMTITMLKQECYCSNQIYYGTFRQIILKITKIIVKSTQIFSSKDYNPQRGGTIQTPPQTGT